MGNYWVLTSWKARYAIGRIAGVLDCPCGQGPKIQRAGRTLTDLLDHRSLYETDHPDFTETNNHVRMSIDSLCILHNQAALAHQQEIDGGSPVSLSHGDHQRAHHSIVRNLQSELENLVPFSSWVAHENSQ